MPPTSVLNTAAPAAEPIDPKCRSTGRHGTTAAYSTDHCRCPAALRARYLSQKRYRLEGRLRNEPAVGTARRLQALRRIGYSQAELGARLGVAPNRLNNLVIHRYATVRITTADAVRVLYERLSDRRGPSGVAAGKAAAAGYAPPIAWDDDTIDDPDAEPYAEWPAGGPDPAAVRRLWLRNPPSVVRDIDRVAFIREAHAQGLSDGEIAEYLALTIRHIGRLRRRHGIGFALAEAA